jgi:hypothetical protein
MWRLSHSRHGFARQSHRIVRIPIPFFTIMVLTFMGGMGKMQENGRLGKEGKKWNWHIFALDTE